MGSISPGVSASLRPTAPNIIDIRSDTAGIELKQDILKGLNPENGGRKTLPTLLLYDEKGLRLFEEITYLDEYYLTNQEIWVLENYADRIAERIPNDALIVELGSGYTRHLPFYNQSRFPGITNQDTVICGRSRSYWMH